MSVCLCDACRTGTSCGTSSGCQQSECVWVRCSVGGSDTVRHELWPQPTQTSKWALSEDSGSSSTTIKWALNSHSKWQPSVASAFWLPPEIYNSIIAHIQPIKCFQSSWTSGLFKLACRSTLHFSGMHSCLSVNVGLTCLSEGPEAGWGTLYPQRRGWGTRVWKLRASVWAGCS